MTEQELAEAVGLVARLRRAEQMAKTSEGWLWAVAQSRGRLEALGVVVPPRGWNPPVTVSGDDLA